MYCKKCANKTQTQRLRRQTEGANCTCLPTRQHYKKHKISCQFVFLCFYLWEKERWKGQANKQKAAYPTTPDTYLGTRVCSHSNTFVCFNRVLLNSAYTPMLHRAWLSLGQYRNNSSSSSNYYYNIYHQIIKAYGDDIQQHYKHFPSVELSRPDICFLSGVIS